MAIALDAFTDIQTTTGTSLTFSHTCGGSDRLLNVLPIVASGATASGVTYNSVAMTAGGTTMTDESSRTYTFWYLVAPATGANNVVISVTASVFIRGTCASYTGVDQTTPINGSLGKIENTATSPVNVNLTSTVADTWAIGAFRSDAGTQSDGTGAGALTLRAVANSLGYADTNGSLGTTGTEGINFQISSGNGWLLAALIAPSAGATFQPRPLAIGNPMMY